MKTDHRTGSWTNVAVKVTCCATICVYAPKILEVNSKGQTDVQVQV